MINFWPALDISKTGQKFFLPFSTFKKKFQVVLKLNWLPRKGTLSFRQIILFVNTFNHSPLIQSWTMILLFKWMVMQTQKMNRKFLREIDSPFSFCYVISIFFSFSEFYQGSKVLSKTKNTKQLLMSVPKLLNHRRQKNITLIWQKFCVELFIFWKNNIKKQWMIFMTSL